MIVTRIPPLPPQPILSAADKFSHVPKKLAEAESERIQAEAKLARASEKERLGTALAAEFQNLLQEKTRLSLKIGKAEEQRASYTSALEGNEWGILERVADPSVEGLMLQQAALLETWRAIIRHIGRFIEVRSAELAKLETEIQIFSKANGIDYPVK